MKALIVILTLLCLTQISTGQQTKQPSTDFFNKKLSFGIFLGLEYLHLKLKESNWQQTNLKDTFNSINTTNKSGFFLGMQAKVRLTNNLYYRQAFQLTFESADLNFIRKSGITDKINIQNILLGFPIHFLFQSDRDKTRPFVFSGVTPKYLLGQTKEAESLIPLKNLGMTLDVGIGMEIKSKHFAVVPSLTLSNGLINVNKSINTSYSKTISSLKRQIINFTIALK